MAELNFQLVYKVTQILQRELIYLMTTAG